MHCNSSKLIPVVLVAAIGLGAPVLAKSIQRGKTNTVASYSSHSPKADRTRLLNGNGSARHAPGSGASNPNSPAHAGGGTSYNPNLYVY